MSEASIPLGTIKVKGTAECLGGSAVNPPLRDYPHLTLAPSQWGPGVREHSKGVTVEAIARAFALHPDAEAVATSLGVGVRTIAT
jgi:hypothetical protein